MKKHYFLIISFFFFYQLQAKSVEISFEKKLLFINSKNECVTVTPLFNQVSPICSGTTLALLPTTSLNGIIGSWSPSTMNNIQTTTYTFTPNSGQDAIVVLMTITVNIQPNAGVDGSITVCDDNSAPINLYGIITGEQPSGTWTRISGVGGTFNAASGTYTPSIGATTSSFAYTIPGIAPCVSDNSLVTVNINAQPNAGVDGNIMVCDIDPTIISLQNLIIGEQPGGTWTRISGTGGTFNASSGTFTPGIGATTSTFEYIIQGIAPCLSDVSTVTITIIPQPTSISISGNSTICIEGTTQLSTTFPGGTWLSSNPAIATIDPVSGLVTGNSAGIAAISYSTINPLCGSSVTSMNIIVKPLLQTIIICGLTTPNSITFDWIPVVGATSYSCAYTINNAPLISIGSIGAISNYTVVGLQPNDTVILYVTPIGPSNTCFIENFSTCQTSTLGETNFEKESVSFYPNPVGDFIYFKTKIDFNKIEIIDINGRVVKLFSKNEDKLDILELKKGLYFAKVYSKSNNSFFKFIKE